MNEYNAKIGKCTICGSKAELYGINDECKRCIVSYAGNYISPPCCGKATCICYPNIKPIPKV